MPATTAPDLHEQVRRALAKADNYAYDSLEPWDYQEQTAAVLYVFADHCDTAAADYARRALNDQAGGAYALMETCVRAAGQAEYAAARCDFVACDPDGGEPCATHERLLAHAEGDHELCDHRAAADGSAA
jgi:hypothetical protein